LGAIDGKHDTMSLTTEVKINLVAGAKENPISAMGLSMRSKGMRVNRRQEIIEKKQKDRPFERGVVTESPT